MTLDAAYAACGRLAAAHYENFPVASRLLPAQMRPHVAAVYAFARTADDFADEDGLEPPARLALLDWWDACLHEALSGGALPPAPPLGSGPAAAEMTEIPAPAIFTAVAHTIRACGLPVPLLRDLLSAFRQDVTVTRYATWDDVLDYCRRSANPVGRLVLTIGGYRDESLARSSDALCTALQLTNFWQDLAIDWGRGRLYVPADILNEAGASICDLDEARITPPWREALGRVVRRTRSLFDHGRGVCDGVRGRLRYELRATWLGAVRVLDRVESSGFDVFGSRPALHRGDIVPVLWRALTWRAAHRPSAVPPRAPGRSET